MSMNTVIKAIDNLVLETRGNVVSEVIDYLKKNVNIDEDMNNILTKMKEELLAHVVTNNKGNNEEKTASKRKPSKYNMYIKEKCALYKEQGLEGNYFEMAREAYQVEFAEQIAKNKEMRKKN